MSLNPNTYGLENTYGFKNTYGLEVRRFGTTHHDSLGPDAPI
jgi:hypothetical protein